MESMQIISSNLIFKDIEVSSNEDALKFLGQRLFDEQYVKESYIEAVIAREKKYATGLPTGIYGVAIPHTDIVHVNEPGIAIGILNKPVKFIMMGTDDTEIDVKVIFMLAVKEPQEQLQLLERLMTIFQDENMLNNIIDLREESLSNLLNYKLNN
ncbi:MULTISPECIES: PTS sugar transporter subunit IIA [unclassified Clostridioides]|uniref:PTS sugar transporter subunit IIA n=1 Tax=unclassified Clostridioides TaxID=2635829 RepID=UPI001D0CA002|nr:PTS sugar transporter subunit IIA [Clostridioides sp. ES-S-0049-03]MCC0654491.1 PTS sugar transporter subunit IIA [Clostridioides sp. ES-S-0001-03]MCC0678281.1 PTS sugar transporter subunit IIA [Clostridioides sp. ES-W-0018-02]MCC0704952.1 PTS sugar transporter subunit IIA [Clostridioides sp. ES-S-0049-02]MCC0705565.1 PTS sugar transporter subunit IIA [Clostridioides sp. ES-S-0190-01]MCC0713160.1 PTS sugar transporter subunit IIA [Clostridioides sp. ES-W-0017-02]